MNGNWDVGNTVSGANLMVTNGLTINGTLRVGNPSNSWWGGISFTGSQTLSGNGAVVFGDQVRNNPSFNTLRLANGGTTLTIGAGVTIQGQNGAIGYDSEFWGGPQNVSVINQGIISCKERLRWIPWASP